MTKRNIYINAPLTRRVLSYFIDWYLGALCAAFPIAVVSQKLYGTMLKQNLLKIQQPYGFIAGIIGVIFALFYYIYIPFFVYKGQTVGKRICKVKIIQNNNQEVSLKSLVLRQGLGMIVIEGIFVSASALWHQLVSLCIHVNIVSTMMYVGFVVGGISTLMVIFTKEHRAIHDYIGNTKVVSV